MSGTSKGNHSGGGRNWEGLGGPIRVDRPNLEALVDPTLDSCCQREQESEARQAVLKRTLDRFDVVAEKERRRRQLVQTSAFTGCRCCYDPAQDGTAEYPALVKLRAERNHKGDAADFAVIEEDRNDASRLSEKRDEKENQTEDSDDDDDDDDEFDYLLDEDLPGGDAAGDELKALEERRRLELEMELLQREIVVQHGFGAHRQMHPARVLKAAGLATTSSSRDDPVPAVVLHLVDPDSRASASLDLCLENLALQCKGTKFLRAEGRTTLLLDADGVATRAFRPNLRPDADLPALVAIRDGVAVNLCPRLQGLTTDDPSSKDAEIDESAVAAWLDRSGVLIEQPPRLEAVCRIRPEEEALMDYLMTTKPSVPEEPRFDCGMPDCHKSFPHEHVGEKTDQQDGLVVSEQEIVGDGA